MHRYLLSCATLVALLNTTPARAQLTDTVRDAIVDNTMAFEIDGTQLTGPGADWMLTQARNARFTLLGENHLTAETPVFTTAILHALNDHGYSKYLVESGPATTEIVERALASGGISASRQLLTDLPFSIAFLDQLEELDTAKHALDLGYDIWGFDQEFMGSPRILLTELVSLASDDDSKQLAQQMLDKATDGIMAFMQSGDQSKPFMASTTPDEYQALRQSFKDEGAQALFIIDQIQASAAVYAAHAQQRYYDNNSTRIDLMKQNFLHHLRANNLEPTGGWKAVLKAGVFHMGRGLTSMEVYDMGNLASELAILSNSYSFHIFVSARGKSEQQGQFTDWVEDSPTLRAAFAQLPDDTPIVIDLKPLRPILTQASDLPEELENLKFTALRFDAYIFYPEFTPSTPVVPFPGQ